jgi:hypothetical protein
MAHWGIAYAAGPNYNKQWKAFDAVDLKQSLELAHTATQAAHALLDKANPVEQALIESIKWRYPANEPEAITPTWNDAYADAMREVYRAHENDLDVVTLFADAMMNRTPWQLWDIKGGRPAEGADTLEIREVLERAMHSPAQLAILGCCTCTFISWRCRHIPNAPCGRPMNYATSRLTLVTSFTCQPTSTCCAGSTRTWSIGIAAPA